MNSRIFPPYNWVLIGMLAGASIGWATGYYPLCVGVGTLAGTSASVYLYWQKWRSRR